MANLPQDSWLFDLAQGLKKTRPEERAAAIDKHIRKCLAESFLRASYAVPNPLLAEETGDETKCDECGELEEGCVC